MTGLYQDEFVEALRNGVASLFEEWGLSPSTRLALISISENATFRADDPKRRDPVVIRVHRPAYHELLEIESELDWIQALREQSVLVTPRPLPTRDGHLIAGFRHGDELRQVVAFEFMPGREPDENAILNDDFEKLGAVTARLHRHARQWSRPARFKRKVWDFDSMLGEHPHWGGWRQALGLTSSGEAVMDSCSQLLNEQLSSYGNSADRFGLIHADLRLANLLVDDEQLAVIDFDDCGFSWFMYDFAAAISFIETSSRISSLQASWVSGYRSVLALSDEDEQALPMFIMLRRILLTAWVASHSETPTAQEMGVAYTDGTVSLARAYLQKHG